LLGGSGHAEMTYQQRWISPAKTTPAARSSGAAGGAARLLLAIVVMVAAGFIASWLWVGLCRVRFPYELEWIENGALEEALRILSHGQPYLPPSGDYVASVYTPLYSYAAALAMRVVGVGFTGPRLVSLLATMVSMLLIGLIVRRLTGSLAAALVASGFYAATYAACGAFFDIARVDALAIFLALLGVTCLAVAETPAGTALSGLGFGLAVLTKQTLLIVPACVAVMLAWRGRRWLYPFLGGFLALGILAVLALQAASNGWFWFYTVSAPAGHVLVPGRVLSFWLRDLLPLAPLAFLATLYGLWPRESGEDEPAAKPEAPAELPTVRRTVLAAFLVGMVLASWASRVHAGGHWNVLMSAFAALAIGMGLGFHRAAVRAAGSPQLLALVCAAVLIQFAILAWNPVLFVPTRADHELGRALVDTLKSYHGEVWVPSHTWAQRQAGKAPGMFWGYLDAVRHTREVSAGGFLPRDLEEALATRRFAAIIVDEADTGLEAVVARFYAKQGPWRPSSPERCISSLQTAHWLYLRPGANPGSE